MMRHNCIRDLEAELMQEVCSDVRIEPALMPLDNNLMSNGNKVCQVLESEGHLKEHS